MRIIVTLWSTLLYLDYIACLGGNHIIDHYKTCNVYLSVLTNRLSLYSPILQIALNFGKQFWHKDEKERQST